MKTALYRHRNCAGELLYVGVSLSAVTRLASHKSNGSHWVDDVADVAVEWHADRDAALQAEAEAIRLERPLHNIIRPKRRLRNAPDAPFENRVSAEVAKHGLAGAGPKLLTHALSRDGFFGDLGAAIRRLKSAGRLVESRSLYGPVYRAAA